MLYMTRRALLIRAAACGAALTGAGITDLLSNSPARMRGNTMKPAKYTIHKQRGLKSVMLPNNQLCSEIGASHALTNWVCAKMPETCVIEKLRERNEGKACMATISMTLPDGSTLPVFEVDVQSWQ